MGKTWSDPAPIAALGRDPVPEHEGLKAGVEGCGTIVLSAVLLVIKSWIRIQALSHISQISFGFGNPLKKDFH